MLPNTQQAQGGPTTNNDPAPSVSHAKVAKPGAGLAQVQANPPHTRNAFLQVCGQSFMGGHRTRRRK